MTNDLSPQLGGQSDVTGREPELSGARKAMRSTLPEREPDITIRLEVIFDAREAPDIKPGDTVRFKAVQRSPEWHYFKGVVSSLSITLNHELVIIHMTLVDAEYTVSLAEPSDPDAINISGNLQSTEQTIMAVSPEWSASVMPRGLSGRPIIHAGPGEPDGDYDDGWGYEEYEDDE